MCRRENHTDPIPFVLSYINWSLWYNRSLYLLLDLHIKRFFENSPLHCAFHQKLSESHCIRSNFKHHNCRFNENDWGPPENQSFETRWYAFEKLVLWFEGDPELELVRSKASVSATRFRWAYFCILKTNRIFSRLHKQMFCAHKSYTIFQKTFE